MAGDSGTNFFIDSGDVACYPQPFRTFGRTGSVLVKWEMLYECVHMCVLGCVVSVYALMRG